MEIMSPSTFLEDGGWYTNTAADPPRLRVATVTITVINVLTNQEAGRGHFGEMERGERKGVRGGGTPPLTSEARAPVAH